MNIHNRRTRQLVQLWVAVVILAAVSLPLYLRAQGELSLRWGNVAGGYGISHGPGYRLAGTSGEATAGSTQSGGLRVSSGFWDAVDEPPPWVPPAAVEIKLFLPAAISN